MKRVSLILIAVHSMFIWCNTFTTYVPLCINSTQFWLSTFRANDVESREGCVCIGTELALFDTNDEYFYISSFIDDYLSDNNMEVNGIWVDILATDNDQDSKYEHSWRTESLADGVWAVEHLEPNENCKSTNTPCCVRLSWTNTEYAGLRDNPCAKSRHHSLCTGRDQCQSKYPDHQSDCDQFSQNAGNICQTGFQLADDGLSCVDVDECATVRKLCHQICENTDGSYTCACETGYQLRGDGEQECFDVDECTENTHQCQQLCHNTDGGYNCSCRQGYKVSTDGISCLDIDECSNQNDNNCQQICNNTAGNYTCNCYTGYSLNSDGVSCQDVDECVQEIYKCQEKCNNTVGSYICDCFDGYFLNPDQISCQDIDECQLQTHDCQQICTNALGNYTCNCYDGYTLDSDNKSCFDTDECHAELSSCQHNCTNTAGSYYCSCLSGYILDQDNVSCRRVSDVSTHSPSSYSTLPAQGNETSKCPCHCSHISLTEANTGSNSQEIVSQIENELRVDKKSLSSYRRRQSSVEDFRPSFQALGYSGIICMVVVIGWIVVPDIFQIFLFVTGIQVKPLKRTFRGRRSIRRI